MTIMNLVRSMLSEKKVPKEFWPEVVNWCVLILNRSPTLVVKDLTPEEAWSGIKPSVEYFRVFGCIGHVHVPAPKRTKLDAKSSKCVLLGVSEESKAYRLYNPLTKKIVVSRDVVFEENESWDCNKSGKEIRSDVLEWGEKEEDTMAREEESESDEENGEQVQDEGAVISSSSSGSTDTEEDNLPKKGIEWYHIGLRTMSQVKGYLEVKSMHKTWCSTLLLKILVRLKKQKEV